MLALHSKKTRLNLNTPFYFQIKYGNEFLFNYLHEKYLKNNKIKRTPWVLSEDELSATMVMYFQSENDYIEWSTDVVVIENILDPIFIYDEENNISTEIIGKEL